VAARSARVAARSARGACARAVRSVAEPGSLN